jgi:Nop14-like family
LCVLRRRERAATKRLKRQVQKERRGAMRELRKDATFLDAEREKVGFSGVRTQI